VIGWKCSCITRSELRGASCEDWKSALKVCFLGVFYLSPNSHTLIKACFSKRCVFLHTLRCVFCPESLANKLHTLRRAFLHTLRRAFLHTLQGVQYNRPFRLLHSLQIHTLEGVQNYTPQSTLWFDLRKQRTFIKCHELKLNRF
jgi:hypothetical protein